MIPMREFAEAKSYAADALKSKDKRDMETAAQSLILWHDFFLKSPWPAHAPLASEAKELAERYQPGIASIKPRKNPGHDGPPLPPDMGEGPPGGEAHDRPPPPGAPRDGRGPRPRPPPPGRSPRR